MVTFAALAAELAARFTAAGIEDAAFEVRCLLEDIGGMPRGGVPSETAVPSQAEAAVRAAAAERMCGRPLQYILGEWDFLSLTLCVGEGVLIPRADTEILCEAAAAALKAVPAPRVLDLCAGSGCVGLGVASLLPRCTVTAIEVSDAAFAFLEKNIARYPQYTVKAVKADILTDHTAFDGAYDAILSNPPYIPAADIAGLMREVQNEPRLALDGGADGLTFYRAILAHWVPKLQAGGLCAVEIGFDQGDAVNRLFGEAGLVGCRVIKDYGGNDRVVLGYRP